MKPPRPNRVANIQDPPLSEDRPRGFRQSATPTSGPIAKIWGDDEQPTERADQLVAGRYRLDCELGEGGMGALWKAYDEVLHVPVAIKLIRADLRTMAGNDFADRLLLEARASARLGHPAIVRTLDFGKTAQGHPFIVMELLDGEDLFSALERRGRVSPKKAIRILLPIAHALAAAHDKGIVHRDIKPENIFLSSVDGQVQPKLIDFGVALVRERGAERLTAAGQMMGSPGYMSPEQARGDEADHRADIWSLCVLLYEMITGRLPFEGKNVPALMRSIIEDTVPPIANFNAGDEELWAIMEAGLRRAPEERWPTMRKLGTALARWALARGVFEDVCGAAIEATWLVDEEQRSGDPLDSLPPPPMSARQAWSDSVRSSLPGEWSATPSLGTAPMSRPAAPSSPDLVRDITPSAGPLPPRESRTDLPTNSALTQSLAGAPAHGSRFLVVVMAVTVMVLALGGLAVWRLTAGGAPPAAAPAARANGTEVVEGSLAPAAPPATQAGELATGTDDQPLPEASAAASASAAPAASAAPVATATASGPRRWTKGPASKAAPPPEPADLLKKPTF